MVGGEPVLRVDEGPHSAVFVDVQVIPDEEDGCVELLVGGDDEVAVFGPREALAASALVICMLSGPVDEAGALAGM